MTISKYTIYAGDGPGVYPEEDIDGDWAKAEGLQNIGWMQAVDDAMITTHLGVANVQDSYEVAKDKLQALIQWHIDVATDPCVNGGYKLVKVEGNE
jgi:hypothetical protein